MFLSTPDIVMFVNVLLTCSTECLDGGEAGEHDGVVQGGQLLLVCIGIVHMEPVDSYSYSLV